MLPPTAPKPKDWIAKDKWVCTARWLHALAKGLFEYCEKNPDSGIPLGNKGDPCFECPAGERCPAYCDATHWKRHTEFYAFENFKIVEQFVGKEFLDVDDILKKICEANQPNHIPEE